MILQDDALLLYERIALRGDGAWVGVLEPGRLRVFQVDVTGDEVQPFEVKSAKPGERVLPKFLNDDRSSTSL